MSELPRNSEPPQPESMGELISMREFIEGLSKNGLKRRTEWRRGRDKDILARFAKLPTESAPKVRHASDDAPTEELPLIRPENYLLQEFADFEDDEL